MTRAAGMPQETRSSLSSDETPVEVPLLLFRPFTNRPLGCGIGHEHEVPGLPMGATGRRPRSPHAILDDPARHGALGEMPNRAPALHLGEESTRASLHLLRRQLPIVRQWNEPVDLLLQFQPPWARCSPATRSTSDHTRNRFPEQIFSTSGSE